MKRALKRILSFVLAITIIFSSAVVGIGKIDFEKLFAVEASAASSNDLIWPCESAYYVTCMYYYKDGSKHSTRYGYTKGIDIAGGGNILAVASGTVETATNLGNTSFGKYVVIKHDNGYRSLYAHLSSYSVSVGQKVSQGQKIGVMGSTGNSSGTHLHFEYEGADPWKTYYNSKYASNIIFEQNVRSNNNSYNSDKTIVNVIDSNYKKNGTYYYYSGHTHTLGSENYEAAHPHKVYRRCTGTGCNYYEYTGAYREVSSCSFCVASHTHTLGSENYEAAHPHRVYRRCTGTGCNYYEYTGTNKNLNSCSSCWYANITMSPTSLSLKVGETKTVSFSVSGCLPEGRVLVYYRNSQFVEGSATSNTITLKGIAPGSFNLELFVYSDSSKTHLIKSASIPVTVTATHYTGKVSFDKSSMDLVIPSKKSDTLTINLSGYWQDGAGYLFEYNENIVSLSQNKTVLTITAKEEGSTDFTIKIVDKNNNNALITSATCRINVSKAKYKLTFDANDGTGTKNIKEVPYGQSVELYNTYTRSGYEFLGWSKNKNSSTAEYSVGSYIMINTDTTLYAVWKPVTLTQVKCIPPNKDLYYIGDSLNTEGLGLLLRYSDGSEKVIRSGYTVSGFSSSTQGRKEITVSYGGKSDSFDVVVRTPEISLSKTALTIHNGQSGTIIASTTPSGQAVTWTSSNTSIATVSNGTITTKLSGTATITAKFIYNGITYSRTCSVTVSSHTASAWEIDRNATCTASGSKHKECTVCGVTVETATIPATGHTAVRDNAVAATCTTSGKTEGSHCSVCNAVIKTQTIIPAKGHTESAWKIDRNATCTANGSKHKECTVCGVTTETATIPATGHTVVKDNAVAATCTTSGKTEGSHCSVCNAVIKAQTTIPAKGHTPSNWIIDDETRTRYKECTVCKAVLQTENIPLNAPTITSCYNEVKGVQLKWNAVAEAEKYNIYRKLPSQSNWTYLATTANLAYQDTDVTGNTVYQYALKAVDQYGYSALSAQKECRFIETPTLLTRTNAVGGVTITWEKVAGATSYRIYRRGAGTDYWFYLGDFPASLDTFTDYETANYFPENPTKNQQAKPKSGNYYRYTVRASYDGKDSSGKDYLIYSGFDTNGLYLKYVATPKLTSISNATNGLQIKWNAVNGGGDVEYRVYRRGAGSTYWYYLGTTTNTTWTDEGVKSANGGYYRYTVRAVAGKDGNGWYSAFDTTGLYLMRLANPNLTSAVSSNAGITVKWGSVKGATSYYVYRKTASSGWTRIAVVSGNTNTTYIDTTAKKGTTYTYTVRAVYGATTSAYNSGISCYDKY